MKSRRSLLSLCKVLILSLFGLSGTCGLPLCQAQNATAALTSIPPFNEAQRLLDNDQFAEAKQLLVSANQAQPNDYRLLILLAQANSGQAKDADDSEALALLKNARSNLSSARQSALTHTDKEALKQIVSLQSSIQRRLDLLVKPAGAPRAILPIKKGWTN